MHLIAAGNDGNSELFTSFPTISRWILAIFNHLLVRAMVSYKLIILNMVTPEQLKSWIETGFNEASVSVEGDGHHFEAVIVANEFEGKSRIQRHQLVYAALGDKMKAEVHALSMKTLTPNENIDT